MQVALALMAEPDARHWGYGLRERAGVRSGVLYPVLQRMLNTGWLADGWEEQAVKGRPPRRYYRLTATGKTALRELIAVARQDPRFRSLQFPDPGPAADAGAGTTASELNGAE